MGILDYLKDKKKKKQFTPIDLLKEKAQNTKKEPECDCVMCKNNDDIKNIRLVYVSIEDDNENGDENVIINQSPVYKIPNRMTLEDTAKLLSYINETIEFNFEVDTDSLECQKLVQKYMPHYGFETNDELNQEIINKKIASSLLTLKKSNVYIQTEYMSKKPDATLAIDLDTPEKTLDFFTVSGNWHAFKQSNIYKDYFNWFTPFTSTSEAQEIYQKCQMELPKAPVPKTMGL